MVKDFEEREGKIEVLEANLEAEKIVSGQQIEELELLRKQARNLEKQLNKMTEKYAEVVDRRKVLEKEVVLTQEEMKGLRV